MYSLDESKCRGHIDSQAGTNFVAGDGRVHTKVKQVHMETEDTKLNKLTKARSYNQAQPRVGVPGWRPQRGQGWSEYKMQIFNFIRIRMRIRI